jgi:hypothetical protein
MGTARHPPRLDFVRHATKVFDMPPRQRNIRPRLRQGMGSGASDAPSHTGDNCYTTVKVELWNRH